MKKYRVEFSGYAYIEAENAQDAEENFELDDAFYSECGIDSIQEVDDFSVEV